jgi:hypothetical protein
MGLLIVHGVGPHSESCGLSGDVRKAQLVDSGKGGKPATKGMVGHVGRGLRSGNKDQWLTRMAPRGAIGARGGRGGDCSVIHPQQVIERKRATNKRANERTTNNTDNKRTLDKHIDMTSGIDG